MPCGLQVSKKTPRLSKGLYWRTLGEKPGKLSRTLIDNWLNWVSTRSWRVVMFRRNVPAPVSRLCDQTDFYRAFEQDLRSAQRCIVIESPFITERRFYSILPLIERAVYRGVIVTINTRNPDEHEPVMRDQALNCISILQELGAIVIYTGALHRKIAIIDNVTWEGSLNILSQSDSCEIMRRTESSEYVRQLVRFTKMAKWYNKG